MTSDEHSAWPDETLRFFDLPIPIDTQPSPASESSMLQAFQLDGVKHQYIASYFDAPDQLAEDLEQRAIWTERDRGLILPILFMYRHYCEVELKHQIEVWSVAAGSPIHAPLEHKLGKLWTKLQGVMSRCVPRHDSDHHVERLLTELDTCDPKSETFRYFLDTQGTMNTEKIPPLDLGRIRRVMCALRNWFDDSTDRAWSRRQAQER